MVIMLILFVKLIVWILKNLNKLGYSVFNVII